MLKLKRSLDVYFGLEEVTMGDQMLFYGTICLMVIIVITGTIGRLVV